MWVSMGEHHHPVLVSHYLTHPAHPLKVAFSTKGNNEGWADILQYTNQPDSFKKGILSQSQDGIDGEHSLIWMNDTLHRFIMFEIPVRFSPNIRDAELVIDQGVQGIQLRGGQPLMRQSDRSARPLGRDPQAT